MKRILARIISLLPFSGIRVFFYRNLLGYRIHDSHIGYGTVVDVKSCEIFLGRIGRFCLFRGPMQLLVDQGTLIGNSNKFHCGKWTQNQAVWSYTPGLSIGRNSKITSGHLFDVSASIVVGDRSWIAGQGSQFWTHGPGLRDKNIRIGSDCYVGSAARFSPGARIGNRVLVALGSVVVGEIADDDCVVAGVPARIIKSNYDWRRKGELEE